MTPVFQSHLGMLGPPRDLLLHPIARSPTWMWRQASPRGGRRKTRRARQRLARCGYSPDAASAAASCASRSRALPVEHRRHAPRRARGRPPGPASPAATQVVAVDRRAARGAGPRATRAPPPAPERAGQRDGLGRSRRSSAHSADGAVHPAHHRRERARRGWPRDRDVALAAGELEPSRRAASAGAGVGQQAASATRSARASAGRGAARARRDPGRRAKPGSSRGAESAPPRARTARPAGARAAAAAARRRAAGR